MPTTNRSLADYLKIIALTLGLFASVMSTTILSILSPQIIGHFAIDYSTWQTRNILFFALFASSQILMGKLTDRFNPYHQLYIGMSLFIFTCIGSVMAAHGGHWPLFLGFQGLQAICDASMALSVVTLIRRSFSENQLGWAFGCFSATMASGAIAGAGIGGLFSDDPTSGFRLGVHWSYAIALLGAIALAALILVKLVVPVDRQLGGGRFSRKEWLIVLTTIAIAIAVYFAQTLSGAIRLNHVIVVSALVVAAGLERYSHGNGIALIPWAMFSSIHYSSAAIRVFLSGIVVNVSLLVFPLALQQLFSLRAIDVSIMLVAKGVILVVLAPICGRIADWNLVVSLIAGLCLSLLSLLVISGIWFDVNIYVACGYYFLFGLASALSSPSQMKLISLAIDKRKIGQGMGFYHFMQFTSGAFAAGLIGSLFVTQSDALTTSAWQSAILACIGLTVARMVIISLDISKLLKTARD